MSKTLEIMDDYRGADGLYSACETIHKLQSQLKAKEQELVEALIEKEKVESDYINSIHDFTHQKVVLVERVKVLEEYQFRVKNRMGKCKREKGWDNMPYLLNLQFDRLFKEIEALEDK